MSILSTIWQQKIFNKNPTREKVVEESPKFGTFLGVYIPCILMLFGVIIFLRLSWIVGQVGLLTSLIIITSATLIALITCISMAAISTNIDIGKGGVYYMLSRSLGIEVGSAIGIPLYLKQSLTIAFCVIGFAESLNDLIPSWPVQTIGCITLATLTILAYTSVKGALKVQVGIFIAIIASLISFFTGSEVAPMLPGTAFIDSAPPVGFWAVFALFFPAMTGVESSVSLSGDLKNPSKSLPIGTITAILSAYIIYVGITLFLVYHVPMDRLAQDPLIMQDLASIPSLIIVGIWGATLSSALGGLLAAPRTLQAIADDGIIPEFFGRTFGSTEEPRIATLATCLIAFAGIYFGSVNIIAPLLAMICLICYAVLNLSAGIETLMSNPSWRPRFSVHWSISLLGALACLIAMLMIDAGSSLISLSIIALIYSYVKKRQLKTSWEDIREGILLFFSRLAIYQLPYGSHLSKSWRPHFLIFTKSSEKHSKSLLKFSESISHSKGFLTIASFISKGSKTLESQKEISKAMTKQLKDNNINAFVQIKEANKITVGMSHMIENYGLGPLTPNTIVFGGIKKEDEPIDFIDVIHSAIKRHYNIVIMNDEKEISEENKKTSMDIHVWWDELHQQNSEFMLILASMLQRNPLLKKTRICLKSIVSNEFSRQDKLEQFQKLSIEKRLPLDIEVLVSPNPETDRLDLVKKFSSNAEVVLISLNPPPDEEEKFNHYVDYLEVLSKASIDLPSLTLVLSSNRTPVKMILK